MIFQKSSIHFLANDNESDAFLKALSMSLLRSCKFSINPASAKTVLIDFQSLSMRFRLGEYGGDRRSVNSQY